MREASRVVFRARDSLVAHAIERKIFSRNSCISRENVDNEQQINALPEPLSDFASHASAGSAARGPEGSDRKIA